MVTTTRKTMYTPNKGKTILGKKSLSKTETVVICDLCGEPITFNPDVPRHLYHCDVCGKDVCLKCSKQFPDAHVRSICKECDQKQPELAMKLNRITILANAKDELTNLSIIMDNEYERLKTGRPVLQ